MHLSAHPALQGLATFALSVTTELVTFIAFTAAPLPLPGSRLAQNSLDTRQLLDQNDVNPLLPFALYTAFPCSDYYGSSDACLVHRWTAHLRKQASHVPTDTLYEMV